MRCLASPCDWGPFRSPVFGRSSNGGFWFRFRKPACSILKFGRELRSTALCLLFLHPSHQRDTAHRPIGTGRLRARRRFGYWGEQIGYLRDQSGHHFGARRQNSSLQSRVGGAPLGCPGAAPSLSMQHRASQMSSLRGASRLGRLRHPARYTDHWQTPN
jgi:hypothetical protein